MLFLEKSSCTLQALLDRFLILLFEVVLTLEDVVLDQVDHTVELNQTVLYRGTREYDLLLVDMKLLESLSQRSFGILGFVTFVKDHDVAVVEFLFDFADVCPQKVSRDDSNIHALLNFFSALGTQVVVAFHFIFVFLTCLCAVVEGAFDTVKRVTILVSIYTALDGLGRSFYQLHLVAVVTVNGRTHATQEIQSGLLCTSGFAYT